jgi:hypothetical protein|tara:strand:- start:1343 stop:2845 length:1503 start_codon:yes stop_codon:yes gene_type:complete
MAKQSVGIGSSANDGTGDTLRDGAIKVNANFDELYTALGNDTTIQVDISGSPSDGQVLKWTSSPSGAFRAGNYDILSSNLDTNGHQIVCDGTDNITLKQTGTGDIKFWAGGSGSPLTYVDGDDGYFKWYAPYANAAGLPIASDHQGMFAYANSEGKGYYCNTSAWVPLIDETSSISLLSDVDTTVNGGPSDGQVLKWVASTSKWSPANDEQGTGGSGGTTQNLFETFTGDTGTTTASAPNDTFNIVGGTNIATALVGDTLTINMTGTLGDPDQNLFSTFGADNGQTSATVTTDTLNFLGGTGISTNLNAGAITITNDSPNIAQNVIQTVSGNTGSYTANATDSTVTITGGTGCTTSVSGSTLTVDVDEPLPAGTVSNTGHSFYFDQNYAVVTQESPVLWYNVTSNGDSAYRFSGPGVADTADDPTFYVYRGFTYVFYNSTGSAHPFEIRVSNGGSAVTNGISGDINGTLIYTIPMNVAAGTTHVYQCTAHPGMVGNLVVV